MILKYSVGIDVSSKDLKACICSIDLLQTVRIVASRTFPNSANGFDKLMEWMAKNHKLSESPMHLCLEATGIYHEQCAYTLHEAGIRVSIIVPTNAKRYLQALGIKSKNDKIDARGLAQMGAEQKLPAWEPMGMFFYELRGLTRQHQDASEQATCTKNKLHAELRSRRVNKLVVKHLKAAIKLFEKQEEELAKAIEQHVKGDAEVYRKVRQVCAIKGLAMLSVSTVLAETGGFALFENRRQLVSYAGYDVVENLSGSHRGKTRISKKGNYRIRRIMFMPAFSAVTHGEPVCVDLHERTLARHGVKMKSYVAVQKKLLMLIYDIYMKDVEYDPQHYKKLQEGIASANHKGKKVGTEHEGKREIQEKEGGRPPLGTNR